MKWTGKLSALVLGALTVATMYSVSVGGEPRRPHIWRIAQVTLLSTDVPAARDFYEKLLPAGHIACEGCAKVPNNTFMVNSGQSIYLSRASSPVPANLLVSVAFATDNLAELRRYLVAQGVECSPPASEKLAATLLSVRDPEKLNILFLKQPHYPELRFAREPEEKLQIIHAGFIVHDRGATERFYRDILGFRPYWHGGMKDDQIDWVSMQVPDGTDWLEFMVNVLPDADQRLRGVMNHIALGVPDVHAAEAQLRKNGWTGTEQPKIGRDGKWQLNLYDPDDTRVELMEFTPTQKPCCSEYTGPHPKP